jgi:spermidine synthase
VSVSAHWFTERDEASGSSIGYRVEARLADETTPYQHVEVYATTHWGNLMVIDGCVMLTSRDNFLYHEMLTHPALYTHAAPREVAIIGGGDCGTLREVLRHPEVHATVQVEIDECVTRLAEKYFPELCESNHDPRARLLFGDGIRYMADVEPESLDLVIVDSTDPVGPAAGLFGADFYASCFRALRAGGILVEQSEGPLVWLDLIRSMRRAMREVGFSATCTLPFPQPCYPTGWWSCTLARKGGALDAFRESDARDKPFATHYYNADVHRAALAVPEFLRIALSA